MGKFVYKFESVKKIKETIEKKVQKEISILDLEIEEMNRSLSAVADEKESFRKSIDSRTNIKASELKFFNDVENLLELQIKKIIEQIRILQVARENKLKELIQKTKETKIFESLEEKHLEDYRVVQNQLEQKEIDEIATKKFVRED